MRFVFLWVSIVLAAGAACGSKLPKYKYTDEPDPRNKDVLLGVGDTIVAERTSVGRYTIKFVGLQKQPGHSEIVQVTGMGSLLRTCQIFAWSNSGDGTGLQAAVECRDGNGSYVDTRYEILVIE
jgi:hypothetical protein